jgi:hypothetical protein
VGRRLFLTIYKGNKIWLLKYIGGK